MRLIKRMPKLVEFVLSFCVLMGTIAFLCFVFIGLMGVFGVGQGDMALRMITATVGNFWMTTFGITCLFLSFASLIVGVIMLWAHSLRPK